MSQSTRHVHVRLRQRHMATTFDLCISCEHSREREADSVLEEALRLVAALERELSEFLPDSPVHRLNSLMPQVEIPVPLSVIELLEQSESIRNRTHGAFDCTAKSGPFSRQSDSPRIGWSPEKRVAWKITPDARLSFGAIGKGYALDRVRALIDRQGFTDYLLNAGGSSLVFSGFAAPGIPWQWAWSWKRDSEGRDLGIPFTHSTGERICIGVSGLHEQGKHLIHPGTGAQAADCQSALVAHPSAAAADALSTALFVSQGELESPGAEVPCATASIDQDGVPRWNGWFQRFWGSPGGLNVFFAVLFGEFFGLVRAFADEGAEQAVDLGELGSNSFTPYVFSREPYWAVLPALSILLVLIHLIQYKPFRKAKSKKGSSS